MPFDQEPALPGPDELAALTHAVIEAMNGSIDLELFCEDLEIVNAESAVTSGTYHGFEGAARWHGDLFGAFAPGARLELESVEPAGPDRVVGLVRLTGEGSASGIPVVMSWWFVGWYRGRRAARIVGFRRRDEALAAARADGA